MVTTRRPAVTIIPRRHRLHHARRRHLGLSEQSGDFSLIPLLSLHHRPRSRRRVPVYTAYQAPIPHPISNSISCDSSSNQSTGEVMHRAESNPSSPSRKENSWRLGSIGEGDQDKAHQVGLRDVYSAPTKLLGDDQRMVPRHSSPSGSPRGPSTPSTEKTSSTPVNLTANPDRAEENRGAVESAAEGKELSVETEADTTDGRLRAEDTKDPEKRRAVVLDFLRARGGLERCDQESRENLLRFMEYFFEKKDQIYALFYYADRHIVLVYDDGVYELNELEDALRWRGSESTPVVGAWIEPDGDDDDY